MHQDGCCQGQADEQDADEHRHDRDHGIVAENDVGPEAEHRHEMGRPDAEAGDRGAHRHPFVAPAAFDRTGAVENGQDDRGHDGADDECRRDETKGMVDE